MENLYPTMIENFKRYRAIAEPLKDEQGNEISARSNISVPYPMGIIESEIPRLAGKLPRVRVFPRKPIDQKKIDLKQTFIYYALDRMNFLKTQALWLRQYKIYGWSPLYFFWREEHKNVLKKISDPMTGELTLQKSPVKAWDDAWCRVIDVFDAFLQPGISDPDDCDWFMFREYVSKRDVKLRVEEGLFYPEALEYVERKESPNTSPEEAGRQERDSLVGQTKDVSKYSFGKYEVMYTLEDNRIVAMLDRAILAAVGDNPNPLQEKPVINCNLTALVGEPIGIGTIESLGGLIEKLNALTNGRMDNLSFQLAPVVIANRNSITDWDNFVMEPGNVIFTDDPTERNFNIMKFPDTGQSSEREVQTTKEEMQFVTGTSDYVVGVKSSARMADTATGVSTIVREANARYAMQLSAYESGSLRKVVRFIDAYTQTFLTDQRRIFIAGPEGYMQYDVAPEDLAWDCDVIVEPGTSAPLDQVSRREGLMNLFDRVMKMPNIVRLDKYVREVLESFDFRNIDDIMIPQDSSAVTDEKRYAEGENMAMGMGQPVELKGNHNIHVVVHQQALQQAQAWPVEAQQLLMMHLQQHMQALQVMMQQMMMQQQMMQQQQGGQPGAPGQGNAGPAPGMQPQGRPVAGPQRPAPGPAQGAGGPAQAGAPGRPQPVRPGMRPGGFGP